MTSKKKLNPKELLKGKLRKPPAVVSIKQMNRAFDITRHLDSEGAIAEYLSQVLEEGDSDELIRSLGHIARAKGMTVGAKEPRLVHQPSLTSDVPLLEDLLARIAPDALHDEIDFGKPVGKEAL